MGGGASLHLANSNGAIEAAIAECVGAAAEQEAQRRRSAKDKGQGGSGRRVGSVKTLKSLKSMAMKSYSRQENVYIPHENILSASASHLNKFQSSGKGAALAPLGGSTGSLSSGNSIKPGSTMGSFRKTPPGSGNNLAVNGAGDNIGAAALSTSTAPAVPTPKKGIKPVLRINIQDDADWIQVSDDEGGEDDATVKTKTPRALKLTLNTHAQQSYLFTQSGTIFVDGFKEGIGKDGIHADETSASRLSLHDRIVFLARLGAGASGIVYKALDLWEMRLVAVKMIPVLDRAKRRQCVREVSAMFSILRDNKNANVGRTRHGGPNLPFDKKPHEYLVDFHDAFSNIDEGGVAIMMEYMDGGSLQDIVNDGGCDDETTLANIALQGLEGLAFLHDCAQLHRDLKPGNFLISKRGDCKIADLGILKQMEPAEQALVPTAAAAPSSSSSSSAPADGAEGGNAAVVAVDVIPRTQTFVGTATYMSPERIDGRDYSYPSDVWSFGLSLLTVALGRLPIDTQGGYWTILHSIRDDKPPQVPDDGRFSDDFRDFVACMLVRQPEGRKTAVQLLAHPFLSRACEEDASTPVAADADTDAQSEQGLALAELRAIVSAATQHLERRRAEHLRTAALNLQDDGSEENLERILSHLSSYTLQEAFERVFLKSRDISTLAAQLGLPIELLAAELGKAAQEVGEMRRTVQEAPYDSFLPTPKAAHGGHGVSRR